VYGLHVRTDDSIQRFAHFKIVSSLAWNRYGRHLTGQPFSKCQGGHSVRHVEGISLLGQSPEDTVATGTSAQYMWVATNSNVALRRRSLLKGVVSEDEAIETTPLFELYCLNERSFMHHAVFMRFGVGYRTAVDIFENQVYTVGLHRAK